MSTKDLALLAKAELKKTGGQPTFLGYKGFPDIICISLNDEVVHGIPSSTKLIRSGDILSLDFGVTYEGMITDSAKTIIVGEPLSQADVDLVDNTKAALEAAIRVVRSGIRVGDIGAAVSKVLEAHHYGVVRDLVGHAVGHELHEIPNIPNYGKPKTGPELLSGMTIAIEPMATLGNYRVKADHDHWTVRTLDGSRSAHFEHTILITDNGSETLTKT
jgi:methionyl aminopeptidase